MKRIRNTSILLALLLFSPAATPSLLLAQVSGAEVSGRTLAPDGTPTAGVQVVVNCTATGFEREVTSDQAGRYSVPSIPPGNCQISGYSVSGTPFTSPILVLSEGDVVEFDVHFSDRAAAPPEGVPIRPFSSALASAEITELPLNRYRNPQKLLNLWPGVSPPAPGSSVDVAPLLDLSGHVDGLPLEQNRTSIDGVALPDAWEPFRSTILPPSPGVVQLMPGDSLDSSIIRSSGPAAWVVTTQSGTNAFHGSIGWGHENGALDARNYFNLVDRDEDGKADRPRSQRNLGTFNVGGPLKEDRLFFFAAWEGLFQSLRQTGLATVPTEEMRAGDFSGLDTVIYDPRSGLADGSGKTFFEGNQIPTSRLASQALAAQNNLLPLPNIDDLLVNNYEASGTEKLQRSVADFRLDWKETDDRSWWGKVSWLTAELERPSLLREGGGGAITGGFDGEGSTDVKAATGGHSWVISPNLVADGVAGFSLLEQDLHALDLGKGNYGQSTLGIPGTNSMDDDVCILGGVNRCGGAPAFLVDGFTPFGQTESGSPFYRDQLTLNLSQSLLWTKGDHQIQGGYDVNYFDLEHWQADGGVGARGAFAFNREMTGVPGQSVTDANAWASFLLGYQSWMGKSLQWELSTAHEWQHALFIRDRWRVSPNLTLSLGLRWEYYPLVARDDRPMEYLDLESFQVVLSNSTSVSRNLFAPRVGFAYRLANVGTIRGGYAVTYDPLPLSGVLRGDYPLVVSREYSNPNPYKPFTELKEGIPLVAGPDLEDAEAVSLPSDVRQRTMPDSQIDRASVQAWNLHIQRELPFAVVVSAGYVGNRTTHQFADQELNWSLPGTGDEGRQLFPDSTASIRLWNGWLDASYHAFQLAVDRRFHDGFFLKGSYTFSKAINMTDGERDSSLLWSDPAMLERNRAEAGYSRPHMFQLAAIYDLPAGAAPEGLAGRFLRDWRLSGIFSFNSNTPFTVIASDDVLNSRGNAQTADQIAETAILGGIGTGNPYFDPSAFAVPDRVPGASCTNLDCYGSVGRNTLRGPSWINLDLALSRAFAVRENLALEFRSECLNVSNTPHFANPNGDASSGGFFYITSTDESAPERILRFSLRVKW